MEFKYTFCILYFFACAFVSSQPSQTPSANWLLRSPQGDHPRMVNKPNVLEIAGNRLVMFNGVQDNCTDQSTVVYSNSEIYIYNTNTNTGYYVPATGDIPDTRLFASAWKSGPNSIMVGGGVFYNTIFSIIDFKAYDPLYELTIKNGFSTAEWKIILPTGDIPSPRTEMSVIQNPRNSDQVFLFGGVSLSGFQFVSYGEMFLYTISQNHFEIIYPGSPVDDGSDGLPKSRYHAHVWWFKQGNLNEIHVQQGVHASGGLLPISEELLDDWAFNVDTRTWRQLFPQPPIGIVRRHGVEFQIKIKGTEYFCTSLGDGAHDGELETAGCAYPIVTINTTVCSDPTANNGNGSWFELETSGDVVRSKYPAGALVNKKVYMFAGTREVPLNDEFTQQKFNGDVRILSFK